MRLRLPILACALLITSLAAHASSLTLNYSAAGASVQNRSQYFGLTSTPFAQFNPALGTLSSIDISVSGSYTSASNNLNRFVSVTPASNSNQFLILGSGPSTRQPTFNFSGAGSDSFGGDLAYFEGAGTQALILNFDGPGSGMGSGSITYNYTAAAPVAVTPEPSSFALLGTGVLGMAGVLKRRFA